MQKKMTLKTDVTRNNIVGLAKITLTLKGNPNEDIQHKAWNTVSSMEKQQSDHEVRGSGF